MVSNMRDIPAWSKKTAYEVPYGDDAVAKDDAVHAGGLEVRSRVVILIECPETHKVIMSKHLIFFALFLR